MTEAWIERGFNARGERLALLEKLLEELEAMALESGDAWTLDKIAAVLGPLEERYP